MIALSESLGTPVADAETNGEDRSTGIMAVRRKGPLGPGLRIQKLSRI